MKNPPVITISLEPKTQHDRDRLDLGLQKLAAEDPALHVRAGDIAGTVVIGGIGEMHLEIIVDRLRREFGVEATLGTPQIAYKEMLRRPADSEMKYSKQSSGRGQYGHVKIRVYPGEPGTGYLFVNEVAGGAIPEEYIQSVEEGIREALTRGALAGHPIDDVRVELYDGSYHEVDSSDMAFKLAASMAFREAAKKAEPVALEPIMHIEVMVPKEYSDEVTRNLSSRRGHIQSQDDRGGAWAIHARVPLSELSGYASDLRARTQGRGAFSMRFDRYEQIPEPPHDPGIQVREPRSGAPNGRSSSASVPEP